MYNLLYYELDVVCIFMLLLILVRESHNIDKRSENLTFQKVIIATIFLLLLDILWRFSEGQNGGFFYFLNTVTNILCFFQVSLVSFMWLMFTIRKLNHHVKISNGLLWLMMIPLLLLFVLCVTSPWTHWIFYIGAGNIYQRGDLYFIQLIISYAYLLVAASYTLYTIFSKKRFEYRSEASTLLSFYILPTLGGIVATLVFGLPVLLPCLTLSLLVVFIDFQSLQISIDSLTGLNNRRQFDKYLYHLISEPPRGKKIFLILIDINDFKKINDTYGHLEGDKALMDIALILKKVCSIDKVFLSRYGGDEFAVVYECLDRYNLHVLLQGIRSEFDLHNRQERIKYPIEISMGVGEYSSALGRNISRLIALADKELYAAKNQSK